MKKILALILAAALCACALAADTPPPPSETITVDAYNKLKAERDVALQQAALVPQYEQRVAYLQILAERNELAVRVVQQQLNEAVARAQQLQAELNDARVKAATPPAPPMPTPPPESKK